jgi:hypothetical protein
MSSAFTQMIIFGRSFGDSLKSLIQLFSEFLLKTLVFEQIAGAFSGGGISGWFGRFFSGLAGKQGGGSVSPGRAYLVGEAGPELFLPGIGGNIVPMTNIGGNTVNNYIDARGADPSVAPRLRRVLREVHQSAVETAERRIHEQSWRAGE